MHMTSFVLLQCSESGSKLQAVNARVALLEDERSALRGSVAQEREAVEKTRCEVDKLYHELSQLQAGFALR
jgi:uncharacterized coiled-coil protein SlyX